MTDRQKEIIARLTNSMNATLDLFGGLSPAELSTDVYQDGAKWTVRQVLAHFITIERSMQWLFKNILAGGPGSPEDFDFERFNRTQPQKLDGLAIEALMAQFKAVRIETIDLVESMADADLDRQGRHAFHGKGRLERFIRWAYEHVDEHETDIRRTLAQADRS